MSAHCFRYTVTLLILLLTTTGARAQPADEHIGTVRQPLVAGTLVDAATREAQGLLTLSNPQGTCSASMLNDYWAITAAHCVFSATAPCPQFAANQVTLAASWVSVNKTITVRRIITYGTPVACPNTVGTPNDVALLQVGPHDFGRPDVRARKIDAGPLQSNSSVTAYGRGIDALASGSGATAIPTSIDNRFRSANFALTGVAATEFSFFGGNGAAIAGGDSGGPTLVQDWDDPDSPRRKLEWRLIGVHSRCTWACLPGKSCAAPNSWTWASSITQCWDANLLPLRDQILAAIEDVPPEDGFVGTFGAIPADVLARARALYAVNIDEPLMPPPNAAIDVQLTFERCHGQQVVTGCPVGKAYEQWSYNPATHQVLHIGSGKCLNISGARRDAGAPIILYPCSGAPNEKWTVQGATSIWTIKSDLNGMCLHAVPGKAGGGTAFRVSLGTPAALTQMPCNGSSAQQFANVDSDWNARNGPR